MENSAPISASDLSLSIILVVQSLCCFALAAAGYLNRAAFVSDPARTLYSLWVSLCPIVILGCSLLRRDAQRCSYWKAVGRSILAVPSGALLNAIGAVILGAPVGLEYLTRTVNWSILMSFLTIVPAASIFGFSSEDWHRLFAYTKYDWMCKTFLNGLVLSPKALSPPYGRLDYMICFPAHGAVIGAWFGAWPMPLDWERPWQDWPICVTFGAILGYLIGVFASLAFMLRWKKPQIKNE